MVYALMGKGDKPQAEPVPPAPTFPSTDDVAFARKNDAAYGDPNAGFFEPGKASVRAISTNAIPFLDASTVYREKFADSPKRAPVGTDIADDMYQAHLASQRSPLAALGFDPRAMTFSPKSDTELNVAGLYYPDKDLIWNSGKYKSTPVHESMHRGIGQLEKAGMLPKEARSHKEELLVRALMQKHFGSDVEIRPDALLGNAQVERSRKYLNDPLLKQIEDSAATLYHKKQRPMGPR